MYSKRFYFEYLYSTLNANLTLNFYFWLSIMYAKLIRKIWVWFDFCILYSYLCNVSWGIDRSLLFVFFWALQLVWYAGQVGNSRLHSHGVPGRPTSREWRQRTTSRWCERFTEGTFQGALEKEQSSLAILYSFLYACVNSAIALKTESSKQR